MDNDDITEMNHIYIRLRYDIKMISPKYVFQYVLLFNSTFLYQSGMKYRLCIVFEFFSFYLYD